MRNIDSHGKENLFAAVLGVIGGGLFVALATKGIPKGVAQMKQKMASACP